MSRMSYIDNLNEIIIHSKIDLIDKICVMVYSFSSLFKQGNSMMTKMEPKVHGSTQKVAARSQVAKLIRTELRKERVRLEKDVQNFTEPNLRLNKKEGFLFKQNQLREWLLRYFVIKDEIIYSVKKSKKSGYDYDNP